MLFRSQGAQKGVRSAREGRTTAAKGPTAARAGKFYSYKVGKLANGRDLNTPLGRRPGEFGFGSAGWPLGAPMGVSRTTFVCLCVLVEVDAALSE